MPALMFVVAVFLLVASCEHIPSASRRLVHRCVVVFVFLVVPITAKSESDVALPPTFAVWFENANAGPLKASEKRTEPAERAAVR